jgi:hypothetical protein
VVHEERGGRRQRRWRRGKGAPCIAG